jgi:NADH-quinone oxidoreductase subunit M
MLTLLLILIPLLVGILCIALKGEGVKNISLLGSLAILIVSITSIFSTDGNLLFAYTNWIPQLGSDIILNQDGMSTMLCLLTAIAFPLIFIATYNKTYKNANAFYGLMMLTQAGLMGVFTAMDALLFYVFWELALIPVYFLSSIWGGEDRIRATFKFFIYTFAGSLLMLVGIIYLYLHTADKSFDWVSIVQAGNSLSAANQSWMFWLFFIAFAIKMPVFPFHTWQPDAYEQSPTPVTMVLSGVMVKMGLFAVLRWLLPVLPLGVEQWGHTAIVLSVIGIIYASCIAIMQKDLKRLIAYSSIAHIGLMSAAIFSQKEQALQGALIQMFSHGINIIGLWIVVEMIQERLKTKTLSDLGGIALHAPRLAIMLVIISLANIALPLTNGFVGEFLMFSGLFQYNAWLAAIAGLAIILAAVYMLNMLQSVIFGESNAVTKTIIDIKTSEWVALSIIVVLIFVFGVNPNPMLQLISDSTSHVLNIGITAK